MKNRICQLLLVGCAALATFVLPVSAHAAMGDLYVSDATSGTIFKFTSAGTKSTFAAGLNRPAGLAFGREGNLFVSETGSGMILKFTPDGTRSTFASGIPSPLGIVFDGAGNLFVAAITCGSEIGCGTIFKFTPAGTRSTFTSGGPNLADLAFDNAGVLFGVEAAGPVSSGAIIKFTPDGIGNTFTFGGKPSGLAFNEAGNFFVVDSSDSNIFEITPAGPRNIFAFGVDGPAGLAFDDAGNLFVADSGSGNILKFTPDAKKSTFASGLQVRFLAFEPVTEKLRNISARGSVGTGDETLIGGFIVGGNALANNAVVVRALGPSLGKAGVANALADPVLELHNGSGAIIASNDNWQDTQKNQINASGLAPTDKRESAIFATLPAGNYTAVVHGAGETSGVALVEVYSVNQ